MCEITKRVICAAIAADETATDAERDRIAEAVAGLDRQLSITQAAARIGVSRPTLYAMIRAGKLARTASGKIAARSVNDFLNTTAKAKEVRK